MNKATKPNGFVPKVAQPKPLTEEEKKLKVIQFLQQKRENFSISLLCALCRENKGAKDEDLIDKAVALADKLMEKLYPLPETKDMSNN